MLIKNQEIVVGCWNLDTEREMLLHNNMTVPLSRIQFRILYFLANHKETAVSSSAIVKYAWGEKNYATKNTLYVYIHRLRGLIEKDAKNPQYLLSVRKFGYVLYDKYEDNNKILKGR